MLEIEYKLSKFDKATLVTSTLMKMSCRKILILQLPGKFKILQHDNNLMRKTLYLSRTRIFISTS